MKKAFFFVIVGLLILILFLYKAGIWFRKSGVDIHIHDTYFILSYFIFITAAILIIGTLFCVGGTLGTSFRNKFFLVMSLLFLLGDFIYFKKFISGLFT